MRKFGKIAAFLYVTAILAVTIICTINDADKNLKKDITIEAGSRIRIEDFFNDCPADARFVTDVSGIDTGVPAVYQLTVFYGEAFEKDVTLRIEDHTGPKGIALPKQQFTRIKWPEASECVGYLYDLSGIATIEYQNGTPDIQETGDFLIPIVVTDWYNNSTVIEVPFHVIDDQTGPVIKGVHDLDCNGDPDAMNFYDGVTVTDDYDEFPIMKVDDSQVNYQENGTYEIIYKAVDLVGNVTVVTAKLTVDIPEEGADGDSEGSDGSGYDGSGGTTGDPYALASSVMSGLWRGSDVETARAIFNWVHNNIYYQTVYGSQSYESAAYRGFSRRNGDCYVYYCCAKMLLDLAGIPNMMVKRYPVTSNGHYWNLVYLNGEWYHCDATVFRSHPSVYFMCTDEQINDSYHHFNGSLYPARAGGSTEFLASPTPEPSPTPVPSDTPTPTATPVPTSTPVPTATKAPAATVTSTPTLTPTPTDAPVETPTDSPTPTPTDTPEDTPTDSPTPTPTNTPEDTPAENQGGGNG